VRSDPGSHGTQCFLIGKTWLRPYAGKTWKESPSPRVRHICAWSDALPRRVLCSARDSNQTQQSALRAVPQGPLRDLLNPTGSAKGPAHPDAAGRSLRCPPAPQHHVPKKPRTVHRPNIELQLPIRPSKSVLAYQRDRLGRHELATFPLSGLLPGSSVLLPHIRLRPKVAGMGYCHCAGQTQSWRGQI
jgi:hypothetical protein